MLVYVTKHVSGFSRSWIPTSLIAAAFVGVVAGSASCDADLESGCLGGVCSDGKSGEFVCSIDDTHGLPCDVYSVLQSNCQSCHNDSPGALGPFPLLTYDDTQTFNPAVWERMKRAVQIDAEDPRMPLGRPPLDDGSLAILNAWFESCDAGECARGVGTGGPSNDGGADGAGGSNAGGAGGAAP